MTDVKVVLNHFRKIDPKIADILLEINWYEWFGKEVLDEKLIFKSLCRTIVGQQLAGKAADAIFGRFENLLEGNITPERLLAIEELKIREVGLSWAKVRSVLDLSSKVQNDELVLQNLEKMENEELILELSKVIGIGRWTAEMFLMFRLGREDIFSWGDLGLKNGLKKYINKDNPSKEDMESVVVSWSPYKTYGAIAMWHLLDNR
jgi:DNA-3-methyladenine glycosylase II